MPRFLTSSAFRALRPWLLSLLVLLGPELMGCRPYRLPSPQLPQASKVKGSKKKKPDATEMADGSTQGGGGEELKPQHNSYDKEGLLKKKKYKRRRLKHKVGQHRFMGIVW